MCCHLVLFFHLPLSTSLLFYPTTFMENGCWWLGQLLSLGVGRKGCQSLSHMPTPPTTACTPLSHDLPFSPWRILSSVGLFPIVVCSSSSCRGRCCFPHAQAVVLPDLTQLGEELPFSGHSRFSTEWNRVCFPLCFVVWCKLPHAQTVWGCFPML